MKKLTALSLAVLMAGMVTTTAFAADQTLTESSNPQSANSVITTTIEPTYTVTVPANLTVPFNSLTTGWGKIELTSAQLEPGGAVEVKVVFDGELENVGDNNSIIPYAIADGELAYGGGHNFSVVLENAGDSSEKLVVMIQEQDWNNADAGTYTDTVTFEIQYSVAVSPEPSA